MEAGGGNRGGRRHAVGSNGRTPSLTRCTIPTVTVAACKASLEAGIYCSSSRLQDDMGYMKLIVDKDEKEKAAGTAAFHHHNCFHVTEARSPPRIQLCDVRLVR